VDANIIESISNPDKLRGWKSGRVYVDNSLYERSFGMFWLFGDANAWRN
jgi:hypothetical protein